MRGGERAVLLRAVQARPRPLHRLQEVRLRRARQDQRRLQGRLRQVLREHQGHTSCSLIEHSHLYIQYTQQLIYLELKKRNTKINK